MNNNVVGRLTCPICDEPSQDLKVNKNHKLYMYCDNGCAVKLSSAKSKRYLPVLLSGSDVKDDVFGVIISTCKGNKINEIIKQKEVRATGSVAGNDNARKYAANAGNDAGSVDGSRGNTGSDIVGRSDAEHTTTAAGTGGGIIGHAVRWLAADDDDE